MRAMSISNRTRTRSLLALSAAAALTLTGCASGDDTADAGEGIQASPEPAPAQPSQTVQQETESESAAGGSFHERDVRAQTLDVAPEDAVDLAVSEAGGGFVYQLELDWSDHHGAWVYEVEVLDGTTDHEFDLDAMTGAILKHERDDEDDTEREITFAMTPDEAVALAADHVTDGEWIEGWTLSWDDGKLEYDVDVEGGGDDVRIDTESGQVARD